MPDHSYTADALNAATGAIRAVAWNRGFKKPCSQSIAILSGENEVRQWLIVGFTTLLFPVVSILFALRVIPLL
jgi:hypothetical protein